MKWYSVAGKWGSPEAVSYEMASITANTDDHPAQTKRVTTQSQAVPYLTAFVSAIIEDQLVQTEKNTAQHHVTGWNYPGSQLDQN